MMRSVAFPLALSLSSLLLAAGCVVDMHDDNWHSRDDDRRTSGPYTDPPKALLVRVDTGKTMAARPGEGVGLFVEYDQGGRWHIWWTCDTRQSAQRCNFRVAVTAESSSITGLQKEDIGPFDTVQQPSAERVLALTSTTLSVPGLRFLTDPGAVIAVEATMDDVSGSRFFFFTQDGKVNGGFRGRLTNPMLFQGLTP